ncbi:MAG: WS/DGAT/MGAT family O-acyltransferase [Nevskiales bacterium]
MKRLNPLDASWLMVESRETPMHVGNLAIFSLPTDAPEDFIQKLFERAKTSREFVEPWNLKLRLGTLGRALPMWMEDNDIDMDYHFRHSALPKPGGERELGILVSRLHSHQLDFSRPPWECHIIEGLEGNRVALYTKMHHSLIDGVAGTRMMQRMFSTDPNARRLPAPWSVGPAPRNRPEGEETESSPPTPFEAFKSGLRQQGRSTSALVSALRRLVKAARSDDDPLTAPFVAPRSIINARVKGQRRFATQQYDLAQIKSLAKAANCSLNDIVLYLCATAMRRFLKEANQLPDQPLTAGIPVNVRPADDQSSGTAISFIMANLATDVADPLKRLETIKASTTRAKEHLQQLPKSALTQYTMVVMAPYILQLISGLGGRMRPVFNITISNVPGPSEPLYYNGARLEAMYPVSLIAHGGALNITCLSYAGTLNFGFTGCRDTLPHMQRLAVYTGEALEELDKLLHRQKRAKTG